MIFALLCGIILAIKFVATLGWQRLGNLPEGISMATKSIRKLTVWQLLAIGFLFIILLGSVLLSLPIATVEGQSTAYIDALFTATSATCVTGLVAYDTATHWSLFGQIVILSMIQLGGLGFMTFVTLVFRLVGHNLGVYEREALLQSNGGAHLKDMRPLFRRILIGTLFFELVGAGLLFIRFRQDFGDQRGLYLAVFHSISAFCNAGFDILGNAFGDGPFVSLAHYATDPLVVLVVCGLIIIGGLGFCVWGDLLDCRLNLKKCKLHTKAVLGTTTILLIVSTALFLFFERNNPQLENYTLWEKLLVAFFNATSPRTAGFSVMDLRTLSTGSYLMTIVLMFIGGSPGSTAGGIKTTTFAVIIMGMLSVFRGKKDINIGKKRINEEVVHNALAVTMAYLMLVIVSVLLICEFDSHLPFADILFEVTSAIGTVGLTLGITPALSVFSKTVLILLMYAGRVGVLTVALAMGQKQHHDQVRNPVDHILIG